MTLEIETLADGTKTVKGYEGRDAQRMEEIRKELKARMANRKMIKVYIPKQQNEGGNIADAMGILKSVIKSL